MTDNDQRQKKIEFPIEKIKQKELDKTHVVVHITPFENKKLSYTLVLPKEWRMTRSSATQDFFPMQQTILGLFVEKESVDTATLSVIYVPMVMEISLSDYVKSTMEAQGVEILKMDDENMFSRPRVDSGGIMDFENDGEIKKVIRVGAVAERFGFYLIIGTAPQNRYDKLKKDIAIATQSFSPQQQEGYAPLQKFALSKDRTLGFEVSLPSQWNTRILTSKISGQSGMESMLEGPEGGPMAYLRIKAIDTNITGRTKTGHNDLQQITNRELEDSNINVLGQWIADPQNALKEIYDLKGAYTNSGRIGDKKVELRLGIIEKDYMKFVIFSVIYPKEENPPRWMHAKRVYEIALATVRLSPPEQSQPKAKNT